MVGNGGDLSSRVPDEPELATGELVEEIGFGFGKQGESTEKEFFAAAPSLGDQLLAGVKTSPWLHLPLKLR